MPIAEGGATVYVKEIPSGTKKILDNGLWSDNINDKQNALWELVYEFGFTAKDFHREPPEPIKKPNPKLCSK